MQILVNFLILYDWIRCIDRLKVFHFIKIRYEFLLKSVPFWKECQMLRLQRQYTFLSCVAKWRKFWLFDVAQLKATMQKSIIAVRAKDFSRASHARSPASPAYFRWQFMYFKDTWCAMAVSLWKKSSSRSRGLQLNRDPSKLIWEVALLEVNELLILNK